MEKEVQINDLESKKETGEGEKEMKMVATPSVK
jgi:hypothetical protein